MRHAVSKAHLATDLPIFTHTDFGKGALAQLDLFESMGVELPSGQSARRHVQWRPAAAGWRFRAGKTAEHNSRNWQQLACRISWRVASGNRGYGPCRADRASTMQAMPSFAAARISAVMRSRFSMNQGCGACDGCAGGAAGASRRSKLRPEEGNPFRQKVGRQ